MNPLWLLFIIPASELVGFFAAAIFSAAKDK